jgi:ubiquinone/menaquinone biosynthesis C-methylase UbiE
VVWGLDDFQFYTDSAAEPKRVDLRVTQCLECFALYQNPGYTDTGFQVLFAEAGQSYGSSELRAGEQADWLAARGLLQPGLQILDAGCYDGRFLASLPGHLQRVGVDIDKGAVERGSRNYGAQGIQFIQGDFESFQFTGSPDVITMFHVLEHLPRPVAALRRLRAAAHAGTRLVVEVPVLEKGKTNDINGFFSVQHMTHFSRASLENCLARAGWRVVEGCEHPEYNGYRVLAAPRAETAAPGGDGGDLNTLYDYLSAWYQALLEAGRTAGQHRAGSRWVIWGGGAHTEFLYQVTSFFHTDRDRRYIIVDSDPVKHGKTWRGIPVYDAAALKNIDLAVTPVLISSYGSQAGIARLALQAGVPAGNIIKLYQKLRVY